MTACDIAPLVRVANGLLYFNRRGWGADNKSGVTASNATWFAVAKPSRQDVWSYCCRL